jgi:hypothetical protein
MSRREADTLTAIEMKLWTGIHLGESNQFMSVIAANAKAELNRILINRAGDNSTPAKRVVRYDDSFVAEFQAFVGAVRGQSPTLWLELTAPFQYKGARGAQIRRLKSSCPAGRGHCMKPSTLVAILTDLHLWVPVVVLILGIAFLMSLR